MTTPENGTCTHGPMCLWCKPVGPTPENGRSPIPVDRIAIDGDRAWWVGPNSNFDADWDAARFRRLRRQETTARTTHIEQERSDHERRMELSSQMLHR